MSSGPPEENNPAPPLHEPMLGVASFGKIWPDTDHPTLRALKTGSEREKQAAMGRLFAAYTEPVQCHIREKWPHFQEADVRGAAAGFL